jgi:hypothetical protein
MSISDDLIQIMRSGGGDASTLASKSYIKNVVSGWNAFNDQKFSVEFDGDKILIVKKPKKKIQNRYIKIASVMLKKVKSGLSIEEELSAMQGYRSEDWTPLSVMPIPEPAPETINSSDPYDIISSPIYKQNL